eukprot:2991337-Lingulodinium_polyedra.AAC.1
MFTEHQATFVSHVCVQKRRCLGRRETSHLSVARPLSALGEVVEPTLQRAAGQAGFRPLQYRGRIMEPPNAPPPTNS